MVSVFSAVRDLVRLREISVVLVRHGFGEIVQRAGFGRVRRKASTGQSELPPSSQDAVVIESDLAETGEAERSRMSLAERIRLVLQDLGPSFIKLGQIASTRTDLLPPDIIAELRRLQDEVQPVDVAEIRAAVETSLGRSVDELFVWFDDKPLATASIGQVHRARVATDDGVHDVVVKVQKPGVGPIIARDLELLHVLAAAIERAIPETRIYSPIGLVQQFDRSITAELDYLTEAENTERFAQNFPDHPNLRFPKVYRATTSKHVLTLEFFEGMKLDKALHNGYDGQRIAKVSTGVLVKMIYEDGFFHADPHPGNIIIMGTSEQPIVGLIDLGMVGRLSPELRDRCIDLMVAAVRKDPYAVADAVYQIGRPTKKIDVREYRAEAAMLAEKYMGKALKHIDLSAMIRDLVQGAVKYGIEIPPDFMLVGKSLMTLESVAKEMDPDLDVIEEAGPYFLELMKKRYSPMKLGNELWRGMEQLSRVGYDMPIQAREVLEDLRLGRLAIRAEDPGLLVAADRQGHRLYAAIVFASCMLSGAIVVHAGKVTGGVVLFVLAGFVFVYRVAADIRQWIGTKRPND